MWVLRQGRGLTALVEQQNSNEVCVLRLIHRQETGENATACGAAEPSPPQSSMHSPESGHRPAARFLRHFIQGELM